MRRQRCHETLPSVKHKRARRISFLGGQVRIDVFDVPIIGSVDAPYVMIELFDYTCGHCRLVHRRLQQARQRYGDQLSIVTLPVPMNKECNPAAKDSRPDLRHACELAKIVLAL